MHSLFKTYCRIIVNNPKLIISLCLLIVVGLTTQLANFHFDASADSLVLQNDKDLEFYRAIKAKYGSDEYLLIVVVAKNGVFNKPFLEELGNLEREVNKLQNVSSTISILNVPLIKSPKVSLAELKNRVNTLNMPEVDIKLAKQELLSNPFYSEALVSKDGTTTAIVVNFKEDPEYYKLLQIRNSLQAIKLDRKLSTDEQHELHQVKIKLKDLIYNLRDIQDQNIADIRSIVNKYNVENTIYIGGVPMIASDSIAFIKNDLKVFGWAVVVFLIILLKLFFGNNSWILMAMAICSILTVAMFGVLGFLGWPVTVVSSNFISLLLIVSISLTVHLIVKYIEIQQNSEHISKQELITATMHAKFAPCFYTSLTTIVAFSSLMISGIVPVADFGLMMTIGIIFAFVLAFSVFPALVMLLPSPPKRPATQDYTIHITTGIARFIQDKPILTLSLWVLLTCGSIWGLQYLTVENRFIDYYKKSTEIYQGMEIIDRKLGGTTPLDLILDPPNDYISQRDFLTSDEYNFADEEDTNNLQGITYDSYWFNTNKLPTVAKIHAYLESLPETGKVLSVNSAMTMLSSLDENSVKDNIYLSLLYAAIPEYLRKIIFDPYLNSNGSQLRFSIRVYESDHSLRRAALINKITTELQTKFNLAPEQIRLSGMLVLYNNMLQSFFKSQILTIGFVFLAIFAMFIVSFRSFKIAVIAIIPNLVAAVFVLGLMGWVGIPLDLMTITIAAICIGIAVDDTIHYIHRFRLEYAKSKDYWQALVASHQTIAKAMYYTTITITAGFSLLILSNFMPTIYFGALTGACMLVALLADLTLLPIMLVFVKIDS